MLGPVTEETGKTVDLDGQCHALTSDGHQCTRPGTLLRDGGWFCRQHATGSARTRKRERSPVVAQRTSGSESETSWPALGDVEVRSRGREAEKVRRQLEAARNSLVALLGSSALGRSARYFVAGLIAGIERLEDAMGAG